MKPLANEDLEHILKHTLPLWDGVRGKRIFITGGTGFFGAWLLESLAYCNRRLDGNLCATVLTRDVAGFRRKMPHLATEPSIKLLGGDVRDFEFPMEDHEFVIHAAAPTTAVAPGEELGLLETIVGGTRRTISFAQKANARKFLMVSSGAVYGRQPQDLHRIPETYPGGPDWLADSAVYGEGKRVAELMCAVTARTAAIEFSIARCFAFVGPHLPLDQHFAIGNFIGDALAGRTISIQGDGTPMRSYLYAADLAIWLWTMLLGDAGAKREATVLNVGSAEAVSIRELAGIVVDTLKPGLRIDVRREAVAGAPMQRYVPDVQRAAEVLNLRPAIDLKESIRRTAQWHSE